MIISHKHKFIFIKTRKTAGTSIEIALSSICGEEDIITEISKEDEEVRAKLGFRTAQNFLIPKRKYRFVDWRKLFLHRRLKKFYNHMGAEEIRKYIAENTWNSYFKFSYNRNPWDKTISHYYWTKRNFDFESIEEFMKSDEFEKIFAINQYTINENIVVDKIYKFEDLANSLEDISKRIGLATPLQLPDYKAKSNVRQDKRSYKEILSKKEADLIATLFSKEIKHLGYNY